ncbi:MAG: hypothetical protein GYA48_01540 [Chloroflexi bacterium]|nr:hypothetical protein [Chloroflexota bacterium]
MKTNSHTQTTRPAKRNGLILLNLLVLISLACGLPGFANRQPTPTQAEAAAEAAPPAEQTAVPTAQPAPTQELPPLPPAVVEVQPIPGSMLAARQPITIYFNQEMDRDSVENSLQFKPAAEIDLEWLDDSTLIVTPQAAAGAEAGFSFTLPEGIEAANGLTLAADYLASYQAPGELQVLQVLPTAGQEDVNPAAPLVVVFNQPVVPLGGQPEEAPTAFTLKPTAIGKGEWLNTSTYIFYPDPALQGGETYQIDLNPAVKSAAGASLAVHSAEPQSWIFSTSLPRLLSVETSINSGEIDLDPLFTFTFNQPMDTRSVEKALSLSTAGDEPAALRLEWNEDNTQLKAAPTELLERAKDYTLSLTTQAAAQGGTPLQEALNRKFRTVGALRLLGSNPNIYEPWEHSSGYAFLTLEFNTLLAAQKFSDLVRFDPPLTSPSMYTGGKENRYLYISGFVQPQTQYTVTVSADLRDKWGGKINQASSLTLTTTDAPPMLRISGAQSGNLLFLTPERSELALVGRGIRSLQVGVAPLTIDEFISYSSGSAGYEEVKAPASLVTRTVPLNLPANQAVATSVSLSADQQPLDPGLYYLSISSPELTNDWYSFPYYYLLIVSPNNALMKRSSNEVSVWSVEVEDNQPVEGLEYTLFSLQGTALDSAASDEDGLVNLTLPEDFIAYDPVYAFAGSPGSPNFTAAVSNWSNELAPWNFGISTDLAPAKYKTYLYTDRPIYQPGQTVFYRVIVRDHDNARYTQPDLRQVEVKLWGEYSPVTYTRAELGIQTLKLDLYGSASGSFELPVGQPTGYYTLEVQGDYTQGLSFQVAEYRKPEIDLTVEFDQSDWIGSSDITAQINTQYFFGAPASDQEIYWTLYAQPDNPYLPGGYQTGSTAYFWQRQGNPYIDPYYGVYVASGNGRTGLTGSLDVEVSADTLAGSLIPGQSYRFMLEANIQSGTELATSARGSAAYHPAPIYIGVRREQWRGSAGAPLGFSILTTGIDQKESGDHDLTARFEKVDWQELEPEEVPAGESPYVPAYTEVASTNLTTSREGQARVEFTPADPGTYRLTVSGEGAQTEVWLWVAGAGSATWPVGKDKQIQITADAESYKIGQTAQIFIPNPFPDRSLALISIERGRVMRSEVVELEESSLVYDLPILKDDSPNIYVAVTVLGSANQRPDYRQGYLALEVSPEDWVLNVEAQATPEKAQPGDPVQINLRVTGADGQPVQGEFSLALIDKAVLALADPLNLGLVETFYAPMPLGVTSSLLLTSLAEKEMVAAEAVMDRGGGGGGGGAMAATVRQQFPDTAFWAGDIITDADGRATVKVQLPDNLTTWVADVRGLTTDTRVGESSTQVVTSKDLLIRPQTPRFLVEDDHVRLAAVVNNTTGSNLRPTVSLRATGFTLNDPTQAAQVIDLPAGQSVLVTWWGTPVKGNAEADLVFEAKAGDLSDASTPVWGKLPILGYRAPQTFGTAGALSEEGQRLEVVSLPRSFETNSGEFTVEMAPSLTSVVFSAMRVQETYSYNYTEPILSRMLPNLAMLRAIQELSLDDAALEEQLKKEISAGLERLINLQTTNGGWGWAKDQPSSADITSWALFALSQARLAGFEINPDTFMFAQSYLSGAIIQPDSDTSVLELDELAFNLFALRQSGYEYTDTSALYQSRERLNPWGKALLALTMHDLDSQEERGGVLLNDLQQSALRTATGAHWEAEEAGCRELCAPRVDSAAALYAIVQLDPQSPLIIDAARYLVLSRSPKGAWSNSYENAWMLLALIETARASGELSGEYDFSAVLNGSPIAEGSFSGTQTLNPVVSTVPVSELRPSGPNALLFEHGAGEGWLYYRAYLELFRPAASAPAIEKGVSVERRYTLPGQTTPLDAASIAESKGLVEVQLTLVLPEDRNYLVLEDYIPAGAEIVDPKLKTSQRQVPLNSEDQSAYIGREWGWWIFYDPEIHDEHLRWVARFVPAGTYQINYLINLLQPGEYQVIPTHAWEYYFPEVEGTSPGSKFTIEP